MSHRVTRIYNPFIYNQFDDTCSALALLIMYSSKSFSDFDFGHPLRELLNEKSATAMCRCKSLNVVKIGNSLDKARVYSCNIPRNGEILVGIVDNPNIYDPQIIVSDNAGDKIYPIDMSENIMPRTMCISLSVTEHVKSFPLLTAATIRPLNTFIGGGDLFDNRIVLRFTAKKEVDNIEFVFIWINPEYFEMINKYVKVYEEPANDVEEFPEFEPYQDP